MDSAVIFSAAITTPSLTTKDSPLVTQIPVILGTITGVRVFFPPGVNALAHIKLLWGLVQIFPSNEQGDFAGGDVLFEWPEDISIATEPAQITAVTWNDDDTYEHTITVHIVLTPAATGNSVQEVLNAMNAGGS
ncbi:MAG: hypothetical protein ACRD4Q_00170 [Candidatus Acidiferrales bacterium]